MSTKSPSLVAMVLHMVYRNLRLAIDSTTHSSILGLYKSVPEMFPPRTAHIDSHVDAFLLSDSPPPTLPQLEFVPMFARADRLGGAQTSNTLQTVHHSVPNALSDLPSMLPESKVEDDENKELYKQHMVIVDGWRTFLISLLCEIPYHSPLCRNICPILSLEYRHPVAWLWNE